MRLPWLAALPPLLDSPQLPRASSHGEQQRLLATHSLSFFLSSFSFSPPNVKVYVRHTYLLQGKRPWA